MNENTRSRKAPRLVGVLEFLRDSYTIIVEEWRCRTVFGKLLLPFWLLKAASMWGFIFVLIGFAWYCKMMDAAAEKVIGSLPAIKMDWEDTE